MNEEKTKAVFDTNIFISAFKFGGKPEEAYRLACEGRFILYTSPFILYEVHRVLREYFYWGKDESDFVIGHISRHSQVINPTLSLNVIKDQTDNRILECGVESRSGFIVSGDKHLLTLGV
ncbi:MAG TPA: putative toxin-antitoxin system toxin component, PIN family, partial [Spirochaetota bacterium]|nr:putative toxin-antitoxin system toxin component, PIN family [Spirochaetota bacterium]